MKLKLYFVLKYFNTNAAKILFLFNAYLKIGFVKMDNKTKAFYILKLSARLRDITMQ